MFLYQSTEGLLKSVHLLNGASLQQTKEENAAFFHENGIDSYISTVFGKKVLHPVYSWQANAQDIYAWQNNVTSF